MTSLSRLIRQVPVPRESYPVTPDDERALKRGECGSSGDGDTGDEEADRIQLAYKAGYEAGQAECKEAALAEVASTVKSFTSMVDDLGCQRQRLIRESEKAVVKISCEIAKRIVGKIPEIREEMVVEIVTNALNHLADKQKVTIRVNPQDCEILRQHESEWLAAAGGTGALQVKEDGRIKRGGCLIEGESGSVEAQLDRQIEVIEKALMEAAK